MGTAERDASSDGGSGRWLGKYELIARIGRGGMAEVHLARLRGPMNFRKLVVVKTIHPDLASQEKFLKMLLDEARLSALIKHPRVVDIYDLGHDDGTYFIAMEFLDGEPMSLLMTAGKKGHPLDPLGVARIVADAAEGLHAAHELRSASGKPLDLVHRDVSPGNIIVLHDGNVKIVDFGVAKARGRLTHSVVRQVKGKLGYMAPEQLTGGAVDRRSDVFSLGVVLWEALALRRLFPGDSFEMTLERMTSGNIEPAATFRPHLSPALDAVCRRALEPQPDERFQTAEDMKEALETILRAERYYRDGGTISSYMNRVFAKRRRERAEIVRAAAEPTWEAGLSTPVVDITVVENDDAGESGEAAPPSEVIPAATAAAGAGEPTGTTVLPRRPGRAFRIALPLFLGAIAAGAAGLYLWRSRSAATVAGGEPASPPAVAPDAAATTTPPDAGIAEAALPDAGTPVAPVATPPRRPDPPPKAKSAAALYDEGAALFVKGKVSDAKRRFTDAIKADSRYAPAYRGLGLVYQAQGNKKKAVDSFKKYLKLAPRAADAATIRARIEKLEK